MPKKELLPAVKPEAAAECRAAMEKLLFDGDTPRPDTFALLAKNPHWAELLQVHAMDFDLDPEDPAWFTGIQKESFLVIATARLSDADARPLMNTLTAALREERIPVGFEPYYDVVYETQQPKRSEAPSLAAALQRMPTGRVADILGHQPSTSMAEAAARRLTPPAPPAAAKVPVEADPDAREDAVMRMMEDLAANPKKYVAELAKGPALWSQRTAALPADDPQKGTTR